MATDTRLSHHLITIYWLIILFYARCILGQPDGIQSSRERQHEDITTQASRQQRFDRDRFVKVTKPKKTKTQNTYHLSPTANHYQLTSKPTTYNLPLTTFQPSPITYRLLCTTYQPKIYHSTNKIPTTPYPLATVQYKLIVLNCTMYIVCTILYTIKLTVIAL